MNDHKARELGDKARVILESEAWQEAWNAYRMRIHELIESADSNNTELVMGLKRMLSAGAAAKAHLERLVKDGAVAAATIEAEQRRSGLRKIFG